MTQILVALTVPADMHNDDPEVVADLIARLLNEHRTQREAAARMLAGDPCLDGVHVEAVMVGCIPAAQWLTPAAVDRLRMAADLDPHDIRAVLTAYDGAVRRDCWGPWRDRVATAVGHGR